MSQLESSKGTIIVVDDSRANLQLLGTLFRENGYAVRPFTRAKFALMGAANEKPDLFLLDINMPEMDGYEACRRIKEDPALAGIPVIFLSTLSDANDKVRAFESGGVDYVTKQPFHFKEIMARVEAHIKLRRLQDRLQQQNFQLKESYDQLSKLEELRDKLIHMVVHDLRSPLTVIRMSLQMLMEDAQPGDQSGRMDYLDMAFKSTNALIGMITQLLDISRLEAGQMPLEKTEYPMVELARGALEAVEPIMQGRKVQLLAAEDVTAYCDPTVIRRVLDNLLGNAIKFTPESGTIAIRMLRFEAETRVEVQDSGDGIPPELHAKVFEKFGQISGQKQRLGTGLGLTFCKLAVEAHGGRINVDSQIGQGATFWFTLPHRVVAAPPLEGEPTPAS